MMAPAAGRASWPVRSAVALVPLLLYSPVASAAPKVHQVVIARMAFGPMPAGVRSGDTIIWINRDSVRHTATARGAFDVDLPAGATGRSKVSKVGAVSVMCKYHRGMTATLKVGR